MSVDWKNLFTGEAGQRLLMGLVILAGGGNLLSTQHSSAVTQEEVRQALTEIHTLHQALEPRQKEVDQIEANVESIKAKLDKQ